MKTVSEVSKLSGVSKRTLQYYDKIGLLSPTEKTKADYRLYDDTAIQKLQTVLLFRELKFSLKEISKIVNSSDFNIEKALNNQKRLLELEKEHIENLINLTDNLRKDNIMNFNAFDKSKINEYKQEVKEKWADTPEYKEFESKNINDSSEDIKLMGIFKKFGKLMLSNAGENEQFLLVEELQSYISDNYYSCSKHMLINLGLMYVNDERFKNNIDNAAVKGTAEYVNNAIIKFCK